MSSAEASPRSRPSSPPHKRIRLDDGLSTPAVNLEAGPSEPAPKITSSRPPPKRGKKNRRPPPPEPCSPEDVNLHDVFELLGADAVAAAEKAGSQYAAPIALFTEIELEITDISSHGEATARLPSPEYTPWAVLVPFCVPGERVIAKVYRHSRMHSYADLVRVVTPNPALRDDSLIRCKYFGSCGGCQYQMISYENQLKFKQRVVEKAYQTYSNLPSASVPAVLPTIPSPKQYEYRTKITPHFDAAPKRVQKEFEERQKAGSTDKMDWDARIGFDQKGKKSVIDIEECPIATPVVNQGMIIQRKHVKENIHTYKRAATLLLRDSFIATSDPPSSSSAAASTSSTLTAPTTSSGITQHVDPDTNETHICITSHKATVRERVGEMQFDFPAGSFFQNNNSVLEPLTAYVKEAIFGSGASEENDKIRPTHLVDTYCGSGLFAITLSPSFQYVAGIEIDANAIACAKHNLTLNGLDKHAFHAGKSEDIFASVLETSKEPFPPERTAVVIDPPRKGCDEAFINQVVAFRPSLLVYVSCNVHTQARDVGMLIRKMHSVSEGAYEYQMESLRGFDLFPQTAHVES
ncbi:S-adenosyl-L-methionine-dependent methyltransferase [Clavulina sp. PMI_390]|nr:S-adenosyl-L-methionine-dependent methyltransferase [Clavulina sp. PMI_390]